ncbi:zinc finger domain-containing protein [Streptomyces wuyuanensis]|uniref:zinc finger domain-containing protein n=1 Tax=Streptomyces wuyuanensis TaxID=1196353 RepID=UPI00343AE5BC
MREFTNHKAQQTLGVLRAIHLETLNFSGTHPEATLADFERHLRQRVDALETELEANESAAETAVFTKPLSGPLADPERQRAFKHQESQRPSDTDREAWWKRRTAVLDEIKQQGLTEALDWECRACGAQVGVACQTAGGRPKKEPHFLRATDAELPYLRAYGLR